MKRALIIIVMALFAAFAFAGGTPEDTGAAVASSDANFNETGFPIVKELVTFSVFAGQPAYIEDFDSNWFVNMYEEKTNVHIEWESAPLNSLAEKKNLVFASGDFPDIFLGANLSQDEEMNYGSQGVLAPLNDLIEQHAPTVQKMFAEQPWAKRVITTPDGYIYSLPQVGKAYHTLYPQKFWINKSWLDTVGLEIPTNTAELYTALRAFKTEDPNGNGIADEVPLASHIDTSHFSFIMNAFVLVNPNHYLIVDDGKVKLSAVQPEYRDGLAYLHRLYDEGLLDKESFTRDRDQLRQLGQAKDAARVGSAPGLTYLDFLAQDERASQYTWVPPIEGPYGVQWAVHEPYQYNNGKFAITTVNELPHVAMRWADWFYSEEAWIQIKFGREGQEWVEAQEGQVGTRGEPAVWAFPVGYRRQNQLQNIHMRHVVPVYQKWWMHEGFAGDPDRLEVKLIKATEDYEGYEMPEAFPPVYLTREQVAEIVQLKTAITDAIVEYRARFITGDLDIERSWDSYVEEVESIGLGRFLEIYQEAYDVYQDS